MPGSAYVYASTRTVFGKFGGALSEVRPDDLAAAVISGVLSQVPQLDPAAIDDVVWGNANGAGEDNRNLGRMAGLLAGLPVSVPGTTVNRLCGSSLEAVIQGSRAIDSRDLDIVLTGGAESMTRAPWVLPKPNRAFPAGDTTAVSTALGWRMVNPRMPAAWTVSLGEANELLADSRRISRDRQDEYAVRSHRLAIAAWDDGFYDALVTTLPRVPLDRDESVRSDASVDLLSNLRPAFRKSGGTITAGNASPLSDGASAVLLGSERAEKSIGSPPVARIAGRGAAGVSPELFAIAPVEAANRAIASAGISWNDIDAIELNEAFAVQALACVDMWGVDPEIVNGRGGAIAIGHPLGASGGRIISTLIARLSETNARWGLAAICIGVGQGLAVVVERAT